MPRRAALRLGLLSKAMKTHEARNETNRKNACRDTARSCIGVLDELEGGGIRCMHDDLETTATYLNIRRRLGNAIL